MVAAPWPKTGELTGNIATENLIGYLQALQNEHLELNSDKLKEAMDFFGWDIWVKICF